jgi:hypothetical protein
VDVKRVLSSASWDDEDILREAFHRLPNIGHKGTTPSLECLSFLVESAALSDLFLQEGKLILPVVTGILVRRRKRLHALCHDDAQPRPNIVNRVSKCDLRISLYAYEKTVSAYSGCSIWDIE